MGPSVIAASYAAALSCAPDVLRTQFDRLSVGIVRSAQRIFFRFPCVGLSYNGVSALAVITRDAANILSMCVQHSLSGHVPLSATTEGTA